MVRIQESSHIQLKLSNVFIKGSQYFDDFLLEIDVDDPKTKGFIAQLFYEGLKRLYTQRAAG